jgi:hypothetical protein
MINFEQVKEFTIKLEQNWIIETEGNSVTYSYCSTTPDNILETIDEINNCKTIDDLVRFYEEKGYSNKEAYETIIINLMTLGSIK